MQTRGPQKPVSRKGREGASPSRRTEGWPSDRGKRPTWRGGPEWLYWGSPAKRETHKSSVGSNPTLSASANAISAKIIIMKCCRGCGVEKALSEFSKHNGFKDGHNSKCKACKNAMANDHYQEYREEILARQKPYKQQAWYIINYGITLDDYHQMLEQQDGGCAICGALPTLRRLDVDHCYKTGRVRGLLCWDCNVSIGRMKDDPDRLRSAVRYLEAFAEAPVY
jgi:Recombination endonuclease VII